MHQETLKSFLDFAINACLQAGKITLKYFQTDFSIQLKPDASPVTIADKEAEQKIRAMIEKEYPDHNIVGEEFGQKQQGSRFCWYIDPIDGTRSFVNGVPLFGVMLGLEVEGNCAVGVVHLPALDELVYAARGEGCYWDRKRARVRWTETLSDSLFCTSGAEYFLQAGRQEVYRRLEAAAGVTRTWGDCYGHMLVATGRADFCVDPLLNPWDAAALVPIIEEAGGVFSDWKGNRTIYNHEAISTNPRLLPEILKITSSA